MSGSIPTEAPRTQADKIRTLELVANTVDKAYGAGSLLQMSSRPVMKMPAIPTGLVDLDHRVIGIGGVPRGRITEIFGPYGCGKTTLALQIIAEAQKLGGVGAYVDAEHALDMKYATQLGVDTKALFMSQPDYGEQAMTIAESIIQSGGCDVLVVDSVAALVPKAELDGEIEDASIGLQARLMSKSMRMLAGATRKSGTSLIFINQIREKIGVMFGSPETTSGGRSLGFYASLRLRMWPAQDTKEAVSKKTNIKAVKNRCGIPYRDTDVSIVYGQGFDGVGQTIDLAMSLDVVERTGAYYSFQGERIGMGKDNTTALLLNDAELYAKVQAALQEKLAA